MPRSFKCCLASLGALIAVTVNAGKFRNLDFEDAVLPVVPRNGYGDAVPIEVALPGWQTFAGGFHGEDPTTSVWHNQAFLGGNFIVIYGPEWDYEVIDGNHSIAIATYPGPTPYRPAISQVGTIPNDAKSLLFFHGPSEPRMTVTFAGQKIPIHLLQKRDRYYIIGANIESFAGQTGELRFTAGTDEEPVASMAIDRIHFSHVAGEPKLFLIKDGAGLTLTWPLWAREFDLEFSKDEFTTWTRVDEIPAVQGAFSTLSIVPTNAAAFFRLRRR